MLVFNLLLLSSTVIAGCTSPCPSGLFCVPKKNAPATGGVCVKRNEISQVCNVLQYYTDRSLENQAVNRLKSILIQNHLATDYNVEQKTEIFLRALSILAFPKTRWEYSLPLELDIVHHEALTDVDFYPYLCRFVAYTHLPNKELEEILWKFKSANDFAIKHNPLPEGGEEGLAARRAAFLKVYKQRFPRHSLDRFNEKVVSFKTKKLDGKKGNLTIYFQRVVGTHRPSGYLAAFSEPLMNVFEEYAEKEGIPLDQIRFIYNRTQLDGGETPSQLQMIDGATIYLSFRLRGC